MSYVTHQIDKHFTTLAYFIYKDKAQDTIAFEAVISRASAFLQTSARIASINDNISILLAPLSILLQSATALLAKRRRTMAQDKEIDEMILHYFADQNV